MLKNYIEINLSNDFIGFLNFFVEEQIYFIEKYQKSIWFCVNY